MLCKYCRGHYRYTVCATVTPGYYNPPPFKKSCPEIYEGRVVRQKTKNSYMDHFLVSVHDNYLNYFIILFQRLRLNSNYGIDFIFFHNYLNFPMNFGLFELFKLNSLENATGDCCTWASFQLAQLLWPARSGLAAHK
jgi:hypothetical protein